MEKGITNLKPVKEIPVSPEKVYDGVFSNFLGKLTEPKKKSMRDMCNVSTLSFDDELGHIEVFWRTDLDVVETKIIVEEVQREGKQIELNDWQMRTVIEELFLELSKS